MGYRPGRQLQLIIPIHMIINAIRMTRHLVFRTIVFIILMSSERDI